MGKAIGGLFGGGKKTSAPTPTIIPAPTVSVQAADPTQLAADEVDAQKKRLGRSSMRVDLNTQGGGSGLFIPKV
jgi:hypothetical protein